MKEMVKRVREEKDGFTIAELLIVVAIVAVLVAIAIPVFTSSLNKATAETDVANCRSYYAEQVVEYMNDTKSYTADDLVGASTVPISGKDIPLKGGTITVSYGTSGFKVTYNCTNGADLSDQQVEWENTSMVPTN